MARQRRTVPRETARWRATSRSFIRGSNVVFASVVNVFLPLLEGCASAIAHGFEILPPKLRGYRGSNRTAQENYADGALTRTRTLGCGQTARLCARWCCLKLPHCKAGFPNTPLRRKAVCSPRSICLPLARQPLILGLLYFALDRIRAFGPSVSGARRLRAATERHECSLGNCRYNRQRGH